MERIKIGLCDKMFTHAKTVGSGVLDFPDLPFEWDRSSHTHPITVFTDENIAEASEHPSPHKIAWLYESPEVTRKAYKLVRRNPGLFTRILTFDQSLLENYPHYQYKSATYESR